MITLGIDLSSLPANTAACRIEWFRGKARADDPCLRVDDERLDGLIQTADAVGIDAPLGWPIAFKNAVAEWTSPTWNEEIRDRLRFRRTDQLLREKFKLSPLSVSSDLIALPAMRAMALLRRHGVSDRSGDGRFFEVYPSGSLAMWKIAHQGYKQRTSEGARKRAKMLKALRTSMPWLDVSQRYEESDDALDALIASLTARAAAQGFTTRPEAGDIAAAAEEGWIHLPTAFPSC